MKTIIIYTTKYGTAEKSAKMLESKINGEVRLVNIMKDDAPQIDEYDNVILGGSIYVGRIQKEMTEYVTANLQSLLKKRTGLFICAGSPDMAAREKELDTSFPSELYNVAVCKEVFGSEICFNKLKFFEKFMMKAVKGDKNDSSDLSEEKINNFAKVMSK